MIGPEQPGSAGKIGRMIDDARPPIGGRRDELVASTGRTREAPAGIAADVR
jgi:hypothetical protein